MTWAEWLLWNSAFVLAYTYAGYPLLMKWLTIVRPKPIRKEDISPYVSFVITAYNEEASIADKLKNTLAQDYPSDLLDIIVASDGSVDRTDEIVASFVQSKVKLFRVEGRLGKTAVQNAVVKECLGDVVVFSDATTMLEPSAVKNIVRGFADNSVGVIGGDLSYRSDDEGTVEGGGVSYWRYEKQLKHNESLVSSLIGVSGCFYVVRKDVYTDMPDYVMSDFAVALQAVESGCRVAYEPSAQCSEVILDDPNKEFSMRVRVAIRSYTTLWEKRALLNPFRYGLFSVQLFSHKVLRYATSIFLITIFVTNTMLLDSKTYQGLFLMQLVFYGLSFSAHLARRFGKNASCLSKPYYFMLVHAAASVAFIKYLKGERRIVWEPLRKSSI